MTRQVILNFIIVLTFVTCKNAQNLKWIKSPDGLVEYALQKKGNVHEAGKVVVRAYGIMKAGKIIQDPSLLISEWDSLSQIVSLTEALKRSDFPVGTEGYCKFNFSKWLDSIKRQIFQITLFLRPTFNEKDSSTQIARLESFQMFDSAIFISSERAKKEWAESGGEDFREFLDNSVLPISIELRLREQFVNKQSIDSIVQILNNDLNYEQVRISPNYNEVFSSPELKKQVVFKFVVF